MLLHELDARHPDWSSPRARFLSHDSSKSFPCLPAGAERATHLSERSRGMHNLRFVL